MRETVGRRTEVNCEPRRSQAERVRKAKEQLRCILADSGHQDYFAADSALHKKLKLSEPVVRSVRAELGVPARDERIYQFLCKHDPSSMYLDEMVLKCGGRVTYYCLYQIMTKRGVQFPRRNKQ